MSKTFVQSKLVYCVTSYGKIIGVYAVSDDAFKVQMQMINKGRLAEFVPMPIVYSLNSSENG